MGEELLRLLRQFLRGGAGQRMWDQREWVAGRAVGFCNGIGVWNKCVGQDRCRGDAALFEEDAVEQTAR
ncbi:MAG TPA: hypothetical protein VLM91_10000 [Candidatus Methylomirabilis sp.]|nr:hypothetical protein [Candidatus Methylomirabilis sp.]